MPTTRLSPSAQAESVSSSFMADFLAKKKEMTTTRRHPTASPLREDRVTSLPLIVEFPMQPRHHQHANTNQVVVDEAEEKKSVRFSEYSMMSVFIKPHVDRHQLFYTVEDEERLKRQEVEDILQTRKMVAAARTDGSAPITEDQICRSIGLEKKLTPEKAMRVANHCRQHVNTILLNQDSCSSKELSRISMQSSKSCRLRAHVVAAVWAKYG